MVQTIQIAQSILRDIEGKYDAFFRSINKGILYFVEIREVDGWLTVDIVNSPPENIASEIKHQFHIIDEPVKNPKEASNIFHSIMKASVKPKSYDAEPCPKCGVLGDFIPPTQQDGKNLVVQFKCPNGHEYSKYVKLK